MADSSLTRGNLSVNQTVLGKGTNSVFGSETRVLVAAIVEIVICVLGSVGNFLTCFAVFRNRRLQFATNYFIVSLAVADVLVCTILVPMRAAQHFAFYAGREISKLTVEVAGFIGRINIVASICNLAALSIDRCIALKYPMRYRFSIRFATQRVCYVILAFWIFALVFTSLPKIPGLSDDVFLIGFIVFVLLVTVVIVLAYFRIFHIANQARKHRKVRVFQINFQSKVHPLETRRTSLKTTDAVPNVHEAFRERPEIPVPFGDRSMRKEQHQDQKTAKTIGIVIGAFIILVYPRIILILYHFGAPASPTSELAKFWARILLYSNSVVNPMLYALRMREFRNEFSRILMKCFRIGRMKDQIMTSQTQGNATSMTLSSTTDKGLACFSNSM
ncbi:adenosine receptor A2b-like [Actinia tenebrosa]|uniref:Adenosine receptor A2b-like n=1 Tax=Actinia tenebrosa TaxID=6105 RepID=A0A6P8IGP1_ACTTE|nr:adenosine receptor A2b-like [Actinia tenebrosa]XP_031565993.1 adenosine receptor A2b-like [Actinia tenebrosa]